MITFTRIRSDHVEETDPDHQKRIRQAQRHIDLIRNEQEQYLASQPMRITCRHDRVRGTRSYGYRITKAVPDQITLAVADAVHNFRASIELCLYSLLYKHHPKPERIQFCTSKNAESLEKAIGERNLHRFGRELVDFIIGLQPYPGGRKALYELIQFDNVSKHRLLKPVFGIPSISAATLDLMGQHAYGSQRVQFTGEGSILFSGDGNQMFVFEAEKMRKHEALKAKKRDLIIDYDTDLPVHCHLVMEKKGRFSATNVIDVLAEFSVITTSVCEDLQSIKVNPWA